MASVHVAVVGMSGHANIRGNSRVGKSCLCNRFVRPDEDDFHPNHPSTLSQGDFGGRVVNNDQFLYWGEVTKNYGGGDVLFRVIEQTEFIDDTSFSVFKGSSSRDYFSRCMETKLSSPEKLAYVCSDQLGDEQGFPHQIFPKGRFNVDSFLLVFDVSVVSGRSLDGQKEFMSKLYSAVVKKRKPLVLAATKCDAADNSSLKELRKFAQDKKLVMIECSANLGVNTDIPFYKLASMVHKKLSEPRQMTYGEAIRQRSKSLDEHTRGYDGLLKAVVVDYTATWVATEKHMKRDTDYQEYVRLAGTPAAKNKFRKHVSRLSPEYENANRNISQPYFMPIPLMDDDTSLAGDRSSASHRLDAGSCTGYSDQENDNDVVHPNPPSFRKKLPVRPRDTSRETRQPTEYCEMWDVAWTGPSPYIEDITRMHTMDTNGPCERWLGTMKVGQQNERRKCVVLTTVQGRTDFHWKQFVKRNIDLPHTEYVAGILGIGFIEGELHLVQEKYIGETIDARLTNVRHEKRNRMSVSEVMRHISGILEGMELLHAYGFLHPGLSTKKILVTVRGICKLYDFCLTEDAMAAASIRKTKMPLSLNNFAPETIRSGEYTKESDIWSIGIVIHDILVADTRPFPKEYESNSVAILSARSLTKEYPELRNETLLRCWSEAPSPRPTVNFLRKTYKIIFDSLGKTPGTVRYDNENPYTIVEESDDEDEYYSAYQDIS